ncbi:non-ribosomal peptide synthetase [Micromonospora carbonacea]|uniref:Amino acid adenylation domain-containing protein n=1 Tax=Micromonospora carbonacea TaxID=47853 RepID=A0A7H8XK63_9ACTN|nr:amino acid adenylation domain-containing protein [Micromonospora carbonacea]MBB5827000.1 amino acid adenylation domain-containing protein [Micromonospora carbonacea]QLD25174.1 amino acid adenylation domain-containing protein [Micromonospora carbonacea]
MSVGFVGGQAQAPGLAGPGTDFETLDLVGDLRRVVGWPARAGSVSGVVSWPVGVVGSGVVVAAGLVGVLARYTGQSEVVLGLAGGGVVRVDVAGDPGFGELAGRVEAALASPAADGPGGPVLLHVVDGPVDAVGPEVVDAGVVVWVAGDGSGLRVDFAVEEFSAGWVRGFVDAVVTLVAAGVGEPGRGLSGLTLVSVVERERLLGWGRGPVREVPGAPIHELVLEWAQRSPEAVAGVAGGVVLTYGELARRSAVVAGFLRSVGVGSGDVVSLALDRSLWTLVAALGVLRAGAAYTPMDVAWPAERMRVLLADHGARVVLTVGEVASRVPCPDGVRVVALDEQWPRIEAVGPVDLPAVTVDGPAFVIYTSGSTGTPKGVVLTHEKLTNFLAWMADECAIGPDSRMLHSCTPVFDVALGEIFTALTSGATVVVCSRDELLDARRLTDLIAKEQVTHAFCPPTNLAAVDPADCPSMSCLTLAGEPVPPRMAQRWLAAGVRLINAYGPAEAAVACTWYDASTGWPGSYVPIGWPMPNRQIHIVDPHLNLVPAGAPGEILITGHGIADGYLHRPELTTQRFVTDPHTHQLAYRTGDLARWNTNGALEILGRIDHQIKINGIRIELGEIETTLEQHPDVTTAIVTRRDDNDTPRLIGYVTARDGRTPSVPALREHAAAVLPSYMVPAVIMVLDRFPVGGTGKINRNALPAPDAQRPDVGVDYAEPTTADERLVTTAFVTVLGIDRAGVHDSFFDLGGTSLQSAALAAALDEATDAVVPVSQIRRTPTPQALAAWLATAPRRPRAEAEPSGVARSGPAKPVPLTLSVAKCVWLPFELVCPTTWWVEGELNLRALMAALGDLHRRHEALHARYRRVDPPVAIIPPNPGMPQLLLLTDAPTTQDALDQLADAVQQPLDYTQGRNWRTAVIRDRSTNRTLLGIGIHHIAFDGWSHTLLVRDLTHAYTARANGHAPVWDRPAPTLRQTYDEYARLHEAADLPAQRAYWRTQLRGLPRQGDGELKVPLEQALAWGPKAGHILTVSPQVLQRWDRAAREHRFSRSSYFVAAFATALRAIHHQDDIGLLMIVAKRGSRVLDSAFTTRINSNCVRVRFAPGQDLIRHVQQTVDELMAAQDVPFSESAADPAVGLPSEVVAGLPGFAYQDNLVLPLELPGCRTEEVVEPYAREVMSGLTVEAIPRHADALLRITIRTDLLPFALAEELGDHMLRFLEAGPQVTGPAR